MSITPQSLSVSNLEGEKNPWSRLARWFDENEGRWSDRVNPIVIKEVRQSLKSRQFFYTYTALLLAAWAWSIFGIILLLPAANFLPSGKPLLLGYFVILVVPSLLVIPLAVHRSLAGESDEDTYELLSITTLGARQIVFGKLCSGMLQFLLLAAVLGPCFAFSYLLRGLDVSTVVVLFVAVALMSTLLISFGLMLAALVRGRMGQVLILVLQLLISGILLAIVIPLGANWIGGVPVNSLFRTPPYMVFTVLLLLSLSRLFLVIAAARLSAQSENRSTPVKLRLLELQLVWIVFMGYVAYFTRESEWLHYASYTSAIVWAFAGSIFLGESPLLSPRIRRSLPRSVAGRLTLGWFQPGPLSGMVFSASALIAVTGVLLLAAARLEPAKALSLLNISLLNIGYSLLIWSAVAILAEPLRDQVREGWVLSSSIFVLLAFGAAFLPYSIGGIIYWGRTVPYDAWQITNWVFTYSQYLDGLTDSTIPIVVGSAGLFALFLVLPAAGSSLHLPSLMVPERLKREDQQAKADDTFDPLA